MVEMTKPEPARDAGVGVCGAAGGILTSGKEVTPWPVRR